MAQVHAKSVTSAAAPVQTGTIGLDRLGCFLEESECAEHTATPGMLLESELAAQISALGLQ